MGLTAKSSGNGAGFDPIPEGVELAVCYGVVDLGTHLNPIYNKEVRKVVFMWEIPDVRYKGKDKDGNEVDQPRVISRTYTLSLHEKSQMRPMLEAWRGKKFNEAELEGFDIRKILGAPCQIQVVHQKAKTGDTVYANVGAIMALPKGTPKPKGEMDQVWFSFEEYEGGDLPKLPDWIVKKIHESAEWKKAAGGEEEEESDGGPHDGGGGAGDDPLPF